MKKFASSDEKMCDFLGLSYAMDLGDIHIQDQTSSVRELLLGGFFLTQRVPAPGLERIPVAGFLTVSKCLGEFVPDDWIYWNPRERKSEREDRAKALGIKIDQLDRLTEWCLLEYNEKRTLGYPNIIF